VLGGENGGLLCASTQPLGTVAFYGPQRAEKGATITLCGSVGTPQDIYVKPTPTPHPSTSQSTSRSSAGGGSSSNQGPRPTQTAITHPHPPHSSHPRRP
jgi:hypothetical protein